MASTSGRQTDSGAAQPDGALLEAVGITKSFSQGWRRHLAVLKGADVDQPRNLAKSVTVE